MGGSGVDARALEALIRKVRALGRAGGLYDRTKAALAAEALTQVQLGFRESRDPYGEPWAPLVLREGKPLQDTRRLETSFSTELLADGFRIGTRTFYGRVHQYGATILPKRAKLLRVPVGRGKKRRYVFLKRAVIPARRMVPDPRRLGPIWTAAFRRTVERVTGRYWR